MVIPNKYEFDLIVKHFGHKEEKFSPYDRPEKEEKLELLEKLEFKTLSASEVIRKLLDYLRD